MEMHVHRGMRRWYLLSLGLTPDAAVFLDDVTVSRNHALLVRRQDGLYIDDLGSLNGTWVGGRHVEHRERVSPGEQILLGGCLVVVV